MIWTFLKALDFLHNSDYKKGASVIQTYQKTGLGTPPPPKPLKKTHLDPEHMQLKLRHSLINLSNTHMQLHVHVVFFVYIRNCNDYLTFN